MENGYRTQQATRPQTLSYAMMNSSVGTAARLAWPPRSFVERIYNVQQRTQMLRVGHFGGMEGPDLLIDDIGAFARKLRAS